MTVPVIQHHKLVFTVLGCLARLLLHHLLPEGQIGQHILAFLVQIG